MKIVLSELPIMQKQAWLQHVVAPRPICFASTIDEAGNITDVYVDVPVSPKFDEQAIKVIKKSPAWIPAVDHNRNVKYHTRQSITFGQVD